MREVLFRGKRVVNGKWVEGFMYSQHFPLEFRDDFYIRCYDTDYLVIPETVGQYTGLTDKNGVKVFEGDIIKTHYANTPNSNYIEKVAFDAGRFCSNYDSGSVSWHSALYDGVPHLKQDKTVYMDSLEVIGNIHDNIELLKRKEA